MSELDDDAGALLEQLRPAEDPSPADRERVRAALIAQLGPGAFPGAPPAPKGWGPLAKLLAVSGVAGVVAAGAAIALQSRPTPPPPPRPAPAALPPPVMAPPAPVAAPSAAAPTASARPRRTVQRPAVGEELAILTRAYADLRRGDAAQALAELDLHAKRFPSGALAEERAAARVLALCQLGRVAQARADAARFLRRYPSSPQAARVRSSCGGSTETP